MLNRRKVIKLAAISPLFLNNVSLFAKVKGVNEIDQYFVQDSPLAGRSKDLLKYSFEKRIAVISSPSARSHTLAHFYFAQLLERENKSPLFFNDELGLGDFKEDKAQANFQRIKFKEKIELFDDETSGVFSFRNLFEENINFVLANLKRLNFKIIFIEPKDVKISALDWSLALCCNLDPTVLRNSRPIHMAENSVTLNRESLNFYIKKHSRFINAKTSLKNFSTELFSQGHVETLIDHLKPKQKKNLWRDVTIRNPEHVISNLREVKGWISEWKLS